MGSLPLKLSLACGFLDAHRQTSVNDYVSALVELKKRHETVDLSAELLEAWLNFQRLDNRAKLLMRYVSYLRGEYIPLSLVGSLLGESDSKSILAVLQPLFTCRLATAVKRKGDITGV